MSKISYFIGRTFDVKHHAAHGTILIDFNMKNSNQSLLLVPGKYV
jgi:uncharacterized protein (DUF1684 family)